MTTVTDNREHVCPSKFTGQRVVKRNNEILIKIAEVKNIATLQNRKIRGKREKNIASNKTTELHKYMPDWPIF